MNREQLVFGLLFEDQFFGPRNGFEFRPWQSGFGDDYAENVVRFRGSYGPEIQHRYTLVAGTGTGKTKAVAGVGAWLLNQRLVEQIVFVCPNRSIRRKTQKDFKQYFNIDLRIFNKKKHVDGIPREVQGYILTYGHLMQDPTLHRRICLRTPTLVIFDEIHHLGDEGAWGESALEAFGMVPFVIGLSGTPYRSDNRRIPFVVYEEKSDDSGIARFRAESPYGYTYSLGRAVEDDVCRLPIFTWHDATVEIRIGMDSGYQTVTFEDKLTPEMAALRLRGAVKYGSSDRTKMLADALAKCRAAGRKVIIFLGGDTEGDQTPTQDAKEFLPTELVQLGIGPAEYEIITGDDTEAQAKIESFGVSDKWILISINMISEGTDIPELSAAIFLTSITAKQTTVQRIGRILRKMGENDVFPDAWIFMFGGEEYKKLAEEICQSIPEYEIKLGRRKPREGADGDGGGDDGRRRAEAIGVGDGAMMSVQVKDREYPASKVTEMAEKLKRGGFPASLLNIMLLLTSEG